MRVFQVSGALCWLMDAIDPGSLTTGLFGGAAQLVSACSATFMFTWLLSGWAYERERAAAESRLTRAREP